MHLYFKKTNGTKYAKDKKVTIKCSLDGLSAKIRVQDEGSGIRQSELGKLFERYYRIDNNNANISGFVIGLYLSPEIIHRHQVEIWAESDFGFRTTFHFSIPVKTI